MSLLDITIVEVCSVILRFLHQLIILVAVFVWFGVGLSLYSLTSLFGLVLLVVNGIWLTIFFGILGARYRDLSEIVSSVMRIAFLATPILWIPGNGGRSGIVNAFLNFNPFYHFLQLFRAPLLGESFGALSVAVVLAITLAGSLLAYHFHRMFSKQIPLWV